MRAVNTANNRGTIPFSSLLQVNHDRSQPAMLCRIAHNPQNFDRHGETRQIPLLAARAEVSNSDQLFSGAWAMMIQRRAILRSLSDF